MATVRDQELGQVCCLVSYNSRTSSSYSHAADPETCLEESLTLWLRYSNLIDRAQPRTWRGIVYAVGHKIGGNDMALAEKISENHQCDLQSESSHTNVIILRMIVFHFNK